MSTKSIVIGVLDIQGSVQEHMAMLKKIGMPAILVKTKNDLDKVDGLIIPGGESTTIGKLLKKFKLDVEIKKRAAHSRWPLSIWGTCAGAILISKKVSNRPPNILALMDIEIERNAYGSQLDSFETSIMIPELGPQKIPAIFIRAPKVKRASPKVKVVAEYGGKPVMLREKNLLVTTFHPELTSDPRVHNYFISLVKNHAKKR